MEKIKLYKREVILPVKSTFDAKSEKFVWNYLKHIEWLITSDVGTHNYRKKIKFVETKTNAYFHTTKKGMSF